MFPFDQGLNSLCYGQREIESAPLPQLTFHPNAPIVNLRQQSGNVHAQPQTAALRSRLRLIEAVEDVWQIAIVAPVALCSSFRYYDIVGSQ